MLCALLASVAPAFADIVYLSDQAEEAKLPGIARYARTHPESRERAATLRALVGGRATGQPLLTDEQWQALRTICG